MQHHETYIQSCMYTQGKANSLVSVYQHSVECALTTFLVIRHPVKCVIKTCLVIWYAFDAACTTTAYRVDLVKIFLHCWHTQQKLQQQRKDFKQQCTENEPSDSVHCHKKYRVSCQSTLRLSKANCFSFKWSSFSHFYAPVAQGQ